MKQIVSSLASRIEILTRLGAYMCSEDETWQQVKQHAIIKNSWFTEPFLNTAIQNIVDNFLQQDKLEAWANQYPLPKEPKKVGIVMAGNIPLVGFHDFLCGYITGHHLLIKLSSKDEILLKHLVEKMATWDASINEQVQFSELLKGCDAYIATGSNNSARYFEQYFQKYPHIIRKNRTSVAILDGKETEAELNLLADDVFTYYGLGCRNITQLCVPEGYDFEPLLANFRQRDEMMLHHKYKNNYDYHLALYLLNKVPYITNESVLLIENKLPFSAVSVLHYRYYNSKQELALELLQSGDVQCIVGHDLINFGQAQEPSLFDYADGADTMQFLGTL
ncbi:acyl-CoA reductase [Taibaiella soli]|uniref:Acyl-CoA reductase n=1 Tax=Taibaiella soli TaxID=1649169 RepID=A0A2W2BC23_9BACT|nr:acyl-CoA reductase [Taibaiella soli]PZF71216.1 acyl-CoA reductase [Taibaiella soli]